MNPNEADEDLSRRLFLAGAAGTVAAAGASASAGADEDENGDDEDDAGGGGTETVLVDDNFYEPEDLAIEPGTTVVWDWVGDVEHNVNPSEQPEGADWEGHPELIVEGEYEHTFDVEGNYEYVCDPHVGVGMVGSIEVAEGAAQAAEGPAEVVPDAAWTLIVATVAGMVSTLSLVYFFMRYGGEPAE